MACTTLRHTAMFTYSHANTPLGQSGRAYYLSYFIKTNKTLCLSCDLYGFGITLIAKIRLHKDQLCYADEAYKSETAFHGCLITCGVDTILGMRSVTVTPRGSCKLCPLSYKTSKISSPRNFKMRLTNQTPFRIFPL